ncbi:MAG: sulfite exporter TauE/SafE family protein [Candidatus Omnitrophica bacterium]|nr:sulfite exporter TauE/SafE family protein [Candidatus Omnitrophota bacterium]
MNGEAITLYITAASIGFLHTLFGPDHYLPFIVMSRARRWSLLKTGLITFICGLGHITSSVFFGIAGVILGIAVMRLEALEAVRGNLAGWALIGFGLAYFIWGLRSALRRHPHRHSHAHLNTNKHSHLHGHINEHAHIHDKSGKRNITPWVLFTIFVLGPCEPLIPILMYPAAKNSVIDLVGVTLTFGAVTIMTMLGMVIILSLGINFIPLGRLERYTHALAGAAILLCGAAIQFLGL